MRLSSNSRLLRFRTRIRIRAFVQVVSICTKKCCLKADEHADRARKHGVVSKTLLHDRFFFHGCRCDNACVCGVRTACTWIPGLKVGSQRTRTYSSAWVYSGQSTYKKKCAHSLFRFGTSNNIHYHRYST